MRSIGNVLPIPVSISLFLLPIQTDIFLSLTESFGKEQPRIKRTEKYQTTGNMNLSINDTNLKPSKGNTEDGIRLNKCNQCKFAFSQTINLKNHLKMHRREKSNKCNQCDYTSSDASNLRRHLKTHIGEKSNKCNQCDFASTQAGDLRRHLKTHSGEKSSKCNLLRQGPRLTWVGEPD